MKRYFLGILIIILVSSISYGQESKGYENGYLVKTGDMAPDFTVREAGGRSYPLSDLKGKDSLTG